MPGACRFFSTAPPSGTARKAPAASPKPSAPQRSSQPSVPTLNAVLKKFNLLVHPDLFQSHPAHAAANQESLQALNSLLSTLKTRDRQESYPEKQTLRLVFHIKKKRGEEKWAEYVRMNDLEMHLAKKSAPTNGRGANGRGARRAATGAASAAGTLPPRGTQTLDGEFYVVPVVVSTNGTHCQKLVGSQLASLFYRCGLPFKFNWDAEYWQMGGARDRRDRVDDEGMDDATAERYDREDEAQYDEYEDNDGYQREGGSK